MAGWLRNRLGNSGGDHRGDDLDELDMLELEVERDDARARAEMLADRPEVGAGDDAAAEILRLLAAAAERTDTIRREVAIRESAILFARMEYWSDDQVVRVTRGLTRFITDNGLGPWTSRAVGLGLGSIEERLDGAPPPDDLAHALRELRERMTGDDPDSRRLGGDVDRLLP